MSYTANGAKDLRRSDTHYRCVGVGVGPSNLSVASLLHGDNEIRSIFFEQKPEFSWHDDMLFPGASLQVSLFKDLVTLIDPTNQFSFISYLHSSGKIYHFLNAQFDRIARREFRNYLKWASESNKNVRFCEKVVRVDFDEDFIIETTKQRVTADNIVVGVGTEPRIPIFCRDQLCETHFHVSEFGSKANEVAGAKVAVIGGGQSGAEAVLDLISRSPSAAPSKVTWISRRENFLPMDDSPFTNDYFMPCHSSHFYGQNREFRAAFVQRNVLSSDGISEYTLRQIYQRLYTLRFIEDTLPAVLLMPDRTVHQVTRDYDHWRIMANQPPSNHQEIVHADVVILATGFHSARMDFLAPLQRRFAREGQEFKVDSDFAVAWDGPPDRCVFLLNAARFQRGLADPNLSLISWRAQRVIDRIRGMRRSRQQLPSFITWSRPMAGQKEHGGV